jgi:phage-related baseplate assembly protein
LHACLRISPLAAYCSSVDSFENCFVFFPAKSLKTLDVSAKAVDVSATATTTADVCVAVTPRVMHADDG